MAFIMNEDDIDSAVEILKDASPEHYIYAKYLQDWKDTVNENSDGWPYWKAGYNSASKLSKLVKQSLDTVQGFGKEGMPSVDDMNRSLKQIKSTATKNQLPHPTLEDVPSHGFGMR